MILGMSTLVNGQFKNPYTNLNKSASWEAKSTKVVYEVITTLNSLLAF